MNTRLGVLLGLAALALVAVQPASADQIFYYTNFGGSSSEPASIQKLDVTTSTNTTAVSGLTTPDSLIFSNPTTIIYTQTNTNTVNQVNSDGTGRMVIASGGLNFPEDIALDPGGLSVVVSDSRNDNVVRVGLAPPHTETFLPTLGGPVLGIVYDGSGHLFVNVSASQGPEIVQLDPLTGAVLKSLPLPSKGDGLTFDPSTNTLWAAAPDTTGVIQIADDLSSAVEFDCPNLNDT